jgi:uncharacterized protein YacL
MGFFTDRLTTITNYLSTQTYPNLEQWKYIFSWSFWTESYLGPISEYGLVSLISVLAILVILFIWLRRLKRKQRTAPVYDFPVNQITNIIILIIVMSLVYWFFRYQHVAYVSSRLVVLFTFIVTVFWLTLIIVNLRRVIPAKRKAYLEKERFFRYLPKK